MCAALAPHAGRILAYEIDPDHAARLRARCRGLGNVQCVLGDFLAAAPPREPFAVVGNIPYAATSRIVAWCLRAPRLTAATLVTQREYARKRTGDYGRWTQVTVESWPRFDWRLAGRIGRAGFHPVPAVDSAILRLARRDHALLPAAALGPYRRFVAQGFSGVGGSLHASLRRSGAGYPRRALDAAFHAAGLAPATAVGFVHPDQWITLFRHLHPHPAGR